MITRLLLLAGDRLGLALAGPRVGVGTLAADGQALAVAEATVAGEVHQPLDVHRRLAPEVALDIVVGVDRLADVKDLLVGQVLNALFRPDSELLRDLPGLASADSVDVGERDLDALVRGYVNAGDTGHSRSSFSSTGGASRSPISSLHDPLQTKNRRAHECAAGNRLIGMGCK